MQVSDQGFFSFSVCLLFCLLFLFIYFIYFFNSRAPAPQHGSFFIVPETEALSAIFTMFISESTLQRLMSTYPPCFTSKADMADSHRLETVFIVPTRNCGLLLESDSLLPNHFGGDV